MQKRFQHGFIIGKFMPLHLGHMHLIETAQQSCEQLSVMLCSQPNDPISGDVRLEWLLKAYPSIHILHHPDPLPRDQTREGFWDMWRKSIQKYTGDAEFDAIFSSESYGDRLARELGCTHVAVDQNREKFPISGTEIRENPQENLKFIPKSVRVYYKNR